MSQDYDEVGRKVNLAVEKMVEEIDRSGLRKLQGDMHRCCASCCDNDDLTVQGVIQCQKRCSADLQEAQTYMGRQMQNLQSRLERCAMDCQDKVKDQMSKDGIKEPTDAQMDSYRGAYEGCVNKCVDSHLHLIKGMSKKITQAMRSKSYNIDTV